MWSVIGHESVVQALSRGLEQGRVAHAYLFTGPKGIGKMHLAVNLAQALNCTANEKPCGVCSQCRRIAGSKHADIQIIGLPKGAESAARKTIPIDDIKDMQQSAGLQPYEGRFKVFIIDGADCLSADAGNRLLKTLEEPPASVCLILLATNENAVLETILSRCQTFRMHPVAREKIQAHLQANLETAPEEAALLAALAEGSIGWAVAAAKHADIAEEKRSRYDQIAAMARLPYHDRLEIARALTEGSPRNREEALAWLGLVQRFWHDILLVKGGQAALAANHDRLQDLGSLAWEFSFEQLADVLRSVEQAEEQLGKNANVRLALDVLMLAMPVAKAEEPQRA